MIHERKLTLLMDGLGIKASRGALMIRKGVQAYDDNPGAMISKEVYPRIARECSEEWGYKVNPAQVERNIRTAVAQATQSPCWRSTWQGIGGWGAPTNSEILRRLARESAIED